MSAGPAAGARLPTDGAAAPAAPVPAEPPFGAFPPGGRLAAIAAVTAARPLPRRVRALLRRRLRPLLPRRPVDVTVEGLRLRLHPGGNKVDDDILLKRRLDEPAERAFVRRMLRPGDLLVDVGANVGIATLDALVAGPEGVRAIALEPHPELFPRLRFNLAANGLSARAEPLAVAAGERAGTATLFASSRTNAGRSSLAPFAGGREARFEVPVRPLAGILADRGGGPVGVLKVDVEGLEDAVLVPFLAATPEALLPRAVVVETVHREAWQKDCLTALARRGYIVADTTDENAMLHRTP